MKRYWFSDLTTTELKKLNEEAKKEQKDLNLWLNDRVLDGKKTI